MTNSPEEVTTPLEPESPAPQGEISSGTTRKEKGRVRFNSNANTQHFVRRDSEPPSEEKKEAEKQEPVTKPRPSVLRGNSYNSVLDLATPDLDDDPDATEKTLSAFAAQERAQQLAATTLGSYSAPGSRRNSLTSDGDFSERDAILGGGRFGTLVPSIPLDDLRTKVRDALVDGTAGPNTTSQDHSLTAEAYNLVREYTQNVDVPLISAPVASSSAQAATPAALPEYQEADFDQLPVYPVREGILSKLIKAASATSPTPLSSSNSPRRKSGYSAFSTPASGASTPTRRKWYEQNNQSQDTIATLAAASMKLAAHNELDQGSSPSTPKRPPHKRSSSARFLSKVMPRMEEEARIAIHIAGTLSRQQYIIKLCRALMLYGAPTHRLEEYLRMTARVFEIDAQFLYLPGCMIISFDDRGTHTAEVKIVRTNQGVDLGKLKDVHEVYKEVLHDVIDLEEATNRLTAIMESDVKYPTWVRVLLYGVASAAVAPFAFGGRLIDLPMCFVLGCLVGILQLVVAPRSELYSNVFEITATVLTSFLARALGSINGGKTFCFAAMSQSSIALILPGWLVLCSALELQSRAIVPGSIRMVYAIIYSLFLGFGITVGIALYGLCDPHATSQTSCDNQLPAGYRFLFVPIFTFCLTIINQAKWKQMPVMIGVAMIGYVVNYFSSLRFSDSAQISNTLGALAVGVTANLYSRLRHGVAAAALLPAIFVQVPSGLAATGSLLSGLSTANSLTNSTVPINGTSSVTVTAGTDMNGIVFNVAASMIQIAIGITVGLFLSSLIIYPFGKRRSGLFTL